MHSHQFQIVRRPDYPGMAWVFDSAPEPRAYCGADVETFEHGLVEGCWDGPFAEFDFGGCPNFFGSGVVARGGIVWFCPPRHTVDCLYAMACQGRILVSNSLAVLYLQSGAELELQHNYTRKLATIINGIDNCDEIIYKSLDHTLYRITYDDFCVVDGTPRRRQERNGGNFGNFADYRRYLLETLAACAENAADPRRTRTYRLLTTCSSGYDSNAGAALAAELGCKRALTLRSGREGGVDSGRPVAEILGLDCVERERPVRPTGAVVDEVEFLMAGAGGGDYPLSVFADELEGSLCLSGYHGGYLWDPSSPPNTTLIRKDNSGCSLAEFRLRVGFLHIPVPFIGALRHPSIHAISRSAEMAPYRIGGRYDKPIPRRIIEEARVPRALFGQHKQAVQLIFSWGPGHLSTEARSEFDDFLRRQGRQWRVRAAHAGFHAGNFLLRVVNKGIRTLPLLERPLAGIRRSLNRAYYLYENGAYANLLFLWALQRWLAGAARVDARRAPEGALPRIEETRAMDDVRGLDSGQRTARAAGDA
jgi:hypothetical protein